MSKRHSRRKAGGASNGRAKKPASGSALSTDKDRAASGPAVATVHSKKKRPDVDRRSDMNPRQELAQAIEVQRLNLSRVREVVTSNVSLLRDAEGLEAAGADIGYCCEVISELLEPIIGRLGLLAADAKQPPENAIGEAQHQLYRVHSVTLVVAHALQAEQDEYAANLRLVFVAIAKMMQEALTALDPVVLSIPRR